jgi:hypothetical protein
MGRFSRFRESHALVSGRPRGRLLTAFWDFPVPLSLLAMGVFYLWIYARQVFSVQRLEDAGEAKTSPFHPAAV